MVAAQAVVGAGTSVQTKGRGGSWGLEKSNGAERAAGAGRRTWVGQEKGEKKKRKGVKKKRKRVNEEHETGSGRTARKLSEDGAGTKTIWQDKGKRTT